MDYKTLGIIAAIVAVVAAVLYIWDRRSKHQEIDVFDAAKLSVGAGSIAGGIAYALGEDTISQAVEQAIVTGETVQDMFVGKPGF
jgi:hypothetical protein